MIPIEPELQALKDNLLDMLNLVISQLRKCKEALQESSPQLAEKVIENEKKVDTQELTIDRDCENILALYAPVASDLRFVISSLRISNDLERIGDNADSLARFIKYNIKKVNRKFIDQLRIEEVLKILISMLEDMAEALKTGEAKLAKQSIKKDSGVNEINKKALKITEGLIKNNPDDIKKLLRLFSLVRMLERAGDLTKNIGEEIVFHIEAEVLKHRKADKKN